MNSPDSGEFTGTFTIPYLDNEYTNQTYSYSSEYRSDTSRSDKIYSYIMHLSRYERSIHRGLSNVVCDQNFLDNGTTTNLQASGCWSLMYCQIEVPSSQKSCQGQDSEPDFITTTYRVDCSIQGRENHLQSQQGLHCVST